jgi:hypothetical protein
MKGIHVTIHNGKIDAKAFGHRGTSCQKEIEAIKERVGGKTLLHENTPEADLCEIQEETCHELTA